MVKARYICSTRTRRINWCGRVKRPKLTDRLARFFTSLDNPKLPPITKVKVEKPLIDACSNCLLNSSEERVFPSIAKTTTNSLSPILERIRFPSKFKIFSFSESLARSGVFSSANSIISTAANRDILLVFQLLQFLFSCFYFTIIAFYSHLIHK